MVWMVWGVVKMEGGGYGIREWLVFVIEMCMEEWDELNECNVWFYRERRDGRICEWQLGMIKEGNVCVMIIRLVGGNLKMDGRGNMIVR